MLICNCLLGDRQLGKSHRRLLMGFTLVELLVVIAIIGILVALLLPAIQAARGSALRRQCSNQIRQMGIATQNFVDANKLFPVGRQYIGLPTDRADNGFLSVHYQVLPYIEDGALYKKLVVNTGSNTVNLNNIHKVEVKLFRCPSDDDQMLGTDGRSQPGFGRNNYKACAGNLLTSGVNNNGIFIDGQNRSTSTTTIVDRGGMRVNKIVDGLSKTAAFAEAVLGDGNPAVASVPGDWFPMSAAANATAMTSFTSCNAVAISPDSNDTSYSGRNWIYGNMIPTRYTSIMPPNTKSCYTSGGNPNGNSVTTASSRHSGGVNLCLADCSTNFVADDIEISIWHALGSRNGGETASLPQQ